MATTFGGSDNGCGRCCQSFCGVIRRNLLVVLLGIGAAIGFLIGAVINPTVQNIENPETKATTTMLIGFPGELLMNMLQVIILPLIVASLITAVSHLDARATGKIGRRALLFYLTTTLSAAILGMVLVSSIRPGKTDNPTGGKSDPNPYTTRDSFLDLIRSCFPSNLVEATFRQKKTYYKTDPGKYEYRNVTGNSTKLEENEGIFQANVIPNITTIFKEIYPPSNTIFAGVATNPTGGMNILGLAVFSIVFGVVLGKMGVRAKPLTAFFSSLNDAVMILVTLIMWYAPIGICSLIAQRVASMEDIGKELERLALFIVTVMVGLTIHAFIILPLIFFAVRRTNPFIFMYKMRDAFMTAFGISSSAATLPTTIRCLEENNKVDPRISKFVLPLGATVNMDGAALYEAIAAIFIAQLNDYDLSGGKIVAICLTATAIAIGAAGIPSAGSITTIIVLQAVGLPLDDIGLIMAVDWFLDRFRTTVNVLGDSIGAGVVEHLSRDDLLKYDVNGKVGDRVPLSNGGKPDDPDQLLVTPWMAISAVTVFCMLFVQVKGRGRKRQGKDVKWTGLSQLLGWVCMNVVGGTLAEKTYKSSDVPYYIQKSAQDMGHLATSLLMLFLVVPHFNPSEDIRNPSVRPDGFFDSWDVRTWFVVGFLFLDAWISNLLLKEFSGVTRGVAKAAGVAIVYFASLLYSKDRRANPKLTWIAMGVILGSMIFSIVS